MSDTYTQGSLWTTVLATGYDRSVEMQLRSDPIYRQFVDKHPVDLTNPGPTITLSINQEFAALATTPLTEAVDVTALAPPTPVQVSVTVNEYGNADIATLRLRQLAFTPVDPLIAYSLGKNMVDTLDKLTQTVAEAGTNKIGKNATVLKSNNTAFAIGSVAAGDIFDSNVGINAVNGLRKRNAHGRDSQGNFVGIVHPDVVVDIFGSAGWINPHTYQDTANVYNAEVGTWYGARYISSPRATTATDGAAAAKVYRSTFLGKQALLEAQIASEHAVIGPVIDKLARFRPLGWLYHGGFAVFRQEALQVAYSTSSVGAL